MTHTYEELKHKPLAELREIAAGITHEAVQGYTQLNKDHLLVGLCKALGIDMHAHMEIVRSRERINSAPVVIIACLSISNPDQYERLMAIQSVAAAIENLLLAAHEAGLGACWMAAPLYCPDVVREVLQLPADWDAQALITIGYPKGADEGKRRERVDFREKTIYR